MIYEDILTMLSGLEIWHQRSRHWILSNLRVIWSKAKHSQARDRKKRSQLSYKIWLLRSIQIILFWRQEINTNKLYNYKPSQWVKWEEDFYKYFYIIYSYLGLYVESWSNCIFYPFLTVGSSNQIQQVCLSSILAMNINMIKPSTSAAASNIQYQLCQISHGRPCQIARVSQPLIKRNTNLPFR